MNTLSQILRGLLFFVLTVLGMVMAFIFMLSTAIAVAVLYVVARIKGRPFGVKAYWQARRPQHAAAAAAPAFKHKDVVDVEMREIR